MNYREQLKDKKRIVIKVGSSSLIHKETNKLNLRKLEVLVRELSDLHNQGKDVVLVSSGAIGVGRKALGLNERPKELAQKQACASVGQGMLMMIYQKLFAEYNQTIAQILITKRIMLNEISKANAENTFAELLRMEVIPIVNENDSISSTEIENEKKLFSDNDTLSAIVAILTKASKLILLSDIDGLYSEDPRNNPDAKIIHKVEKIDDKIRALASGSGSNRGTGGMVSKLDAAEMVTSKGIDMVIAHGSKPEKIFDIMDGKEIGTFFKGTEL